MRFVPYDQTIATPNIIVDGAANDGTLLTLSHWPKSGTPAELSGDTSTEIVFNYLDAPRFRVAAEAVSNNHFDEDGLVGILAMLDPEFALRHRDVLIEVAEAGDFGVFTHRRAARIAWVISACADPESSPLPAELFDLPYAGMAGALYVRLLELLPQFLRAIDDYRTLWEAEDLKLTASEALIEEGRITIEDHADLDLAVIRLPDDSRRLDDCHSSAIHNRTTATRLLLVSGRRVECRYRYEGWVQMASRRPALRVDLSGLADELTREETPGGRWVFDGVAAITPRLHLAGRPETSVPVDEIVRRVQHHLRTGQPAWDPYGRDR